ncbi:MAG: hypothetical protein QFB87_01805 [Patescibacteria group bacterium]|nr:hypothetical protein [Patescibacteria group bacterium]
MNTTPENTTALTVKLRTSKLRNRRLLNIRKPADNFTIEYYEREATDIA